jgi:7,8-dihydro-6-hydroxymethylpterin-pyrophosphokinase
MKVIIALGSNIGDSAALLESAVERLNRIIKVTHLSTEVEHGRSPDERDRFPSA